MREIKFKGKTLKSKKWVYGYLSSENYINEKGTFGYTIINKETIGQYTGLHDKNGKEIYEGDIIQYEDICKGVVEYSEKYDQFILKETINITDEYEALGEFNIKVFEVIRKYLRKQ